MPRKKAQSLQLSTPQISDEERLNLRLAGLRKCMEIVAARIRYVTTLLDFYTNALDAQFVSYLQNDVKIRASGSLLLALKPDFIQGFASELVAYREIYNEFEKCLTTDTDCLSLAFAIKVKLKWKEYVHDTNKMGFREERHALLHGKRTKKISDKEYAVRLNNLKAAEDFFEANNNRKYYQEVSEILNTDVFGVIERKFIDTYLDVFVTASADGEMVTSQGVLTDKYRELCSQNLDLLVAVRDRIAKRHAANPRLSESPCADLPHLDIREAREHLFAPKDGFKTATIEETVQLYRQDFYKSEELRMADEADATFVQMELDWIAEQDRISAEEAQHAEDQRLLAKQARREEHKLAVIRAKADKDAQAARKTLDKQQRHVTKVTAELQDSPLVVRDARFTARSFLVDIELVQRYGQELSVLFAHDTTEFAYDRAQTLIENLGGALIADTGSSHESVKFRGKLYQQIDCVTVGGIARRKELRSHNLELFRGVINMVLPAGWQEKLTATYAVRVHPKWRP